jgi:hypothetical protein
MQRDQHGDKLTKSFQAVTAWKMVMQRKQYAL